MTAAARIAMLAPISWRTPPRGYGPWEYATSILTEGLVRRGFDVTLFATLDSETSARLNGVCPRPYSEDPSLDAKVWEILHVAHCFERAAEFDLIHNQADFVPLAFSRLVETPIVTTIHGFSSSRIHPAFEAYDGRAHYVAISDADRHSKLTYAATIHHGVPIEEFPFTPTGGDHLLFYGRIHRDKGPVEAIEAAARAGLPLVMAGFIHDRDLFAREVEPRLGTHARYIGSVAGAARAETLGKARALLHLINFEEPFGLSVVEALACGTPVIALRKGSMPELVEDGVAGFLVDSLDEAVAAIGRIGEIDRRRCRAAAQARFSSERMIDDYAALYRRILGL